MKCEICNKTPIKDGIHLHRVNETGIIGVWRCSNCMTKEQKKEIDPIVQDIINIISPL